MNTVRCAYDEGDYERAVSVYMTGRDSTDPEWHLYGALAYWRLGSGQMLWLAREAVTRALSLHPSGVLRIQCLHTAGLVNLYIGDYVQAHDLFDECGLHLADHPEIQPVVSGYLHYNLGLTHQGRGDLSAALSAYRRALPHLVGEHMTNLRRMCLENAAWVCVELGDYGEADRLLDEAEDCKVDGHHTLSLVRAYLYTQTGEWEAAAEIVTELAGDDSAPGVRSLAMSLSALILLRSGQLDAAWEASHHAVEFACAAVGDHRCLRFAARVRRQVAEAKWSLGA